MALLYPVEDADFLFLLRVTDEGRAAFRAYREQLKRTLKKLPR